MHPEMLVPIIGHACLQLSPQNLRWDSKEKDTTRIEMVRHPQAHAITKHHQDCHYSNAQLRMIR